MKKFASCLLIAAILFAFAACGGETAAVSKDDLAAYIMQNVTFAEQMEAVDSDYAVNSYELDINACSAVCYNSSAAVADTLVVFDANSVDYVPTIRSAVESKIDYLREGYADYGPEEVPKIDGAVVITSGKLVVFCISPDNAAASQLINDYLK